MTKIARFNDAANYANVFADFGINPDSLPNRAVFAVDGYERVCRLEVRYDPTPMAKIQTQLDEVDYAIIEEIARSKYLVSFQIFHFLVLRGFSVKRTGIRNRLNKMIKYRLIREFEILRGESETGLRFYELDYRGFQIAREQNVVFHMGNRFLSDWKKEELGFEEDAVAVKRILAANMVILGLLRNGAAMDGFGFNETVRATVNGQIMDDCILRTQGMFWIGSDSIFLVEVVRSTEHGMIKLADKLSRYYSLVNHAGYLEENAHGHSAIPQLLICAESAAHAREIDTYLRTNGMWSESDTVLYTHDLLYMNRSLRTFYEFNEDGTQIWYSLPMRYIQQKQVCA